ncbi:hypothetical protein TNCV_3783761 [Trichonephila clavipes]|nr:hypothetical protein TNCV_3783761 [Trichonephila clavipes]
MCGRNYPVEMLAHGSMKRLTTLQGLDVLSRHRINVLCAARISYMAITELQRSNEIAIAPDCQILWRITIWRVSHRYPGRLPTHPFWSLGLVIDFCRSS